MRFIGLTLVPALVAGLAACGGDEATGATKATEATRNTGAAAPAETVKAPDADAPEPAAADPVSDVIEKGRDAVAEAVAQADGLVEQITAYLKEDKLELAKKALVQLEALEGKLPASYQEKIDQVTSLIDKAGLGDKAKKLTEGLKLGGG